MVLRRGLGRCVQLCVLVEVRAAAGPRVSGAGIGIACGGVAGNGVVCSVIVCSVIVCCVIVCSGIRVAATAAEEGHRPQ